MGLQAGWSTPPAPATPSWRPAASPLAWIQACLNCCRNTNRQSDGVRQAMRFGVPAGPWSRWVRRRSSPSQRGRGRNLLHSSLQTSQRANPENPPRVIRAWRPSPPWNSSTVQASAGGCFQAARAIPPASRAPSDLASFLFLRTTHRRKAACSRAVRGQDDEMADLRPSRRPL